MPLFQVLAASSEPERNGEILRSEIEKSGACWTIAGSVCLVSTGETVDELRARLARVAAGVRFVISQVVAACDGPSAQELWVWLNRRS
jgi:hypothetical protein